MFLYVFKRVYNMCPIDITHCRMCVCVLKYLYNICFHKFNMCVCVCLVLNIFALVMDNICRGKYNIAVHVSYMFKHMLSCVVSNRIMCIGWYTIKHISTFLI